MYVCVKAGNLELCEVFHLTWPTSWPAHNTGLAVLRARCSPAINKTGKLLHTCHNVGGSQHLPIVCLYTGLSLPFFLYECRFIQWTYKVCRRHYYDSFVDQFFHVRRTKCSWFWLVRLSSYNSSWDISSSYKTYPHFTLNLLVLTCYYF